MSISFTENAISCFHAGFHNLQTINSTIFKTFDSGMDKWTTKIGILGRSFHDLGTAANSALESVIDNINNFDEDVGFWESFKNNLSSKEYGGKDWKKNSFGEIVSKENIDSYIPELDLNSAQGKLKDILGWQDDIKNSDATWQDYYETLGEGEEYITDLIKNTGDLSKLTGEDLVNANQAARNAALAHNEALKSQTLSAQAGKIGFQALATAGNMLLDMGIALAASKAIEGIDYLIHYEERQQEAFENAKTAVAGCAESIRNIKSEMSDTSSKASELSSEFANLVQGVNPFTNENMSLSTESYERFLELNNQLAELFPSLTKNYDENGNAILGLSGDVDTVTASITRLVEQQNELAKAKMREQLDEYVSGTDEHDGVFKVLEGQKAEIENAKGRLNSLKSTYNSIVNKQGSKLIVGSDDYKDYLNDIQNNLGSEARDAISRATDKQHPDKGGTWYTIDFSRLEIDSADMEKITESYNTFYHDLQTILSVKQSELKAKNQEMSDMMMTWLGDVDLYKNADTDLQKAIELMVGSIQWSELNVWDGDIGAAKQLIQSLVLSPLSAACDNPNSKSEIMNALNSLFTLDFSEMSYKDAHEKIKDFLSDIMNAFNNELPDDQPKKTLSDMYSMFGLEDYNKTNNKMFWSLVGISPKGSTDYEKLVQYTQGFTQSQTEAWLSATSGAANAETAIKQYEASLKNASAFPTFSEAWAALDTSEDNSLKNELLSLAETGQLTVESFNNLNGSDSFLSLLGLGADDTDEIQDVIANINELVSSTEQLASMKKGISGLSENLYARQQNPGTAIGAETFSGMDAGLKAQTAEWNNYVSVLGNASSSTAEVQAATDKLAAAYINSNNFLANLTESEKDYYISQLEAMGVANAEELVQEALTRAP